MPRSNYQPSVGDVVQWTSQANGNYKSHTGRVVFVGTVPFGGSDPDRVPAKGWLSIDEMEAYKTASRHRRKSLHIKGCVVREDLPGKMPRFYSPVSRSLQLVNSAAPSPQPNTAAGGRVHQSIAIDVSGSMSHWIYNGDLASGLQRICQDNRDDIFSVLTFGSRICERKIEVDSGRAAATALYGAGMTALNDAIIEAIQVATAASSRYSRSLVVVMTDGGDNRSRNSREKTRQAVAEARRKGVEFILMGAHGGDSYARSVGILGDEFFEWKNTETVETYDKVSKTMRSYSLGEGNFKRWLSGAA